ncbi:MAG: efflux RND transporter periplasmic adaptor subunit [Candidatus Aminicenantes bacterium]|nr:MAG: efflux RND transporter periplasmic adaptor subunit [Candidatus Aminicenantes bacterium]
MNKIKKFSILGLSVALLISSLLIAACKKGEEVTEKTQMAAKKAPAEKEILYYTCGMHPSVKVKPEDYEKGNNKCPICNMDLVPVYKEAEMAMEAEEQEGREIEIKLTPRAQALARVETEEIQFRPLFKEINTVGQVDYDERKVAYVAAWISGRIDKLFVDFTGNRVKKGDPLVWIYSPNLVTSQEEYLLALETLERVKESPIKETVDQAKSLVESSKRRLLLWGVSEKQIKELEERRKANTNMIIYAPIGGTVIHKNAFEGKYVKEGENLYRIADLFNLWILADVYEYEMALIKNGQRVEITSPAYPGEKFEGKISFIDPFLNPKTRTVKVRMNVPNPQLKLKPGMYVNVLLSAHVQEGIHGSGKVTYICPMHPEVVSDKPDDCHICGMALVEKAIVSPDSVLAVPKNAVLDTGARKLVYMEKEKGTYVPKEIELGAEAVALVNGQKRKFYALKAGLTEGMRIVTQANFLIDSQSQITGQAEAIYSGAIEAKKKKKTPPSKHIH